MMKNKLNLVMLTAVVMLFSVVGCQKDESFDNQDNAFSRTGVIECIDFETPAWNTGDIPNQVFTSAGSGPFSVFGYNDNFVGQNAAMIFDSSNPTGNDVDLGSPNTDFGGPGIGVGGELGATYENNVTLGKILIVSEDLNAGNPDDLDGRGRFMFDFSSCGSVTVHNITVIDIEGVEGQPIVEFFGVGNVPIGIDSLPITEDNGVATVDFNSGAGYAGVVTMLIRLKGSGGIDNICIEKQSTGTGCTHTIGYWKTHAGFGPQADVVTPLLPIWLGTNGGAKSLAVTDRFIARDVLKMKTYGSNNNGITKLYAQMLGAKLSIADGADATPIAVYLADADAFLANNDWNDWNSLSRQMKNRVINWKNKFDSYNKGLMGVPHCQ